MYPTNLKVVLTVWLNLIQRKLKNNHSIRAMTVASLGSYNHIKENVMQLSKAKSSMAILTIGITVGFVSAGVVPRVQAALSGPTEHKGLSVGMLAELSEETMQATVGLEGYTMRMRSVGIAPGGQIAQHSHKDRPGIVTVVQGEWVEGQSTGENTFTSKDYGTFPETENTVHWVYNKTNSPATALVCDIARVE